MQKVLVPGATGFIGIEVSRQLAERGMRPTLMVRRPVRGWLTLRVPNPNMPRFMKAFQRFWMTPSPSTGCHSIWIGYRKALHHPIKMVSV